MSPDSFSFSMIVPRDARLAGMVRDLCAYAATYARLADTERTALSARVAAAMDRAVDAGGEEPCRVQFDCQDGEIRVTVAGETVRQALTA